LRYKPLLDEEIVEEVIDYFKNEQKELCQPMKSFTVAIVYATLIRKHFGVPVLESLDDPELLYNNDPNFFPYSNCAELYNTILPQLDLSFDHAPTHINSTIQYFKQEFLLDIEFLSV